MHATVVFTGAVLVGIAVVVCTVSVIALVKVSGSWRWVFLGEAVAVELAVAAVLWRYAVVQRRRAHAERDANTQDEAQYEDEDAFEDAAINSQENGGVRFRSAIRASTATRATATATATTTATASITTTSSSSPNDPIRVLVVASSAERAAAVTAKIKACSTSYMVVASLHSFADFQNCRLPYDIVVTDAVLADGDGRDLALCCADTAPVVILDANSDPTRGVKCCALRTAVDTQTAQAAYDTDGGSNDDDDKGSGV